MKTLVLLSFGHLASHWYIGVFMLVLPLIKKDFMLSFTEVGFLIALRSLAGAVGNSTSGIIVDLIGKRHLILIASATGLGMCWLFVGFAHAYALLLVLFPLSNLFNNLWHAPSMSILSEVYPERRGFALGIHGAAANIGQSVSPVVVGLLITYLGWRTAIKSHMALSAMAALMLILALPELGNFDSVKKDRAVLWELVRSKLLRNRALLLVSVVSALRTMGQRGIETFFPLYLADQIGLNPVWVGFYLSILTFSSTLPEPAMGWLSDQIGRRTILWISLMLSGLSIIALTRVPAGMPLMACMAFLGFFHYSLRPIIFAFALDVTPPEIGATTVSYVFTWNQAISAISPLLGGFLADAFGIQFAIYLIAGLCLTAACVAGFIKNPERQG
jgi:MFS family permease